MVRFAPVLVASVLSGLLVSGCAAAGGQAMTSTAPPSAAPPVPDEEFGSVTGAVTDDEAKPIPGAEVTLIELKATTTADDAGAFTFNEVPPGSFGVVATQLGFSQAARKVEVRAGEVTKLTLILKPVVIGDDPYHVTQPYRTLITFGQALVDNRFPQSVHYCDGCNNYPRITPGPAEVWVEVTFTNGVTVPNDDVWIDLRRNWTNATGTTSLSDGESLGSGYFKDRTRMIVGDASVKSLRNVDRVWLHTVSGTPPSINKRIDSFLTTSYNGLLPEGFTAFPPKS